MTCMTFCVVTQAECAKLKVLIISERRMGDMSLEAPCDLRCGFEMEVFTAPKGRGVGMVARTLKLKAAARTATTNSCCVRSQRRWMKEELSEPAAAGDTWLEVCCPVGPAKPMAAGGLNCQR